MYDLLYSTQVELSVRGLAVLPAALPSPDARLPWLPTPLLLALYVGHAAAAAAAAPAAAAPAAAAPAAAAPGTLTLQNSPTWTLHPFGSDGVHIHGVVRHFPAQFPPL